MDVLALSAPLPSDLSLEHERVGWTALGAILARDLWPGRRSKAVVRASARHDLGVPSRRRPP
jgi:hypothetical protein